MSDFVIVLTTADSKETLKRIAMALIEQKLAACCQVLGPVESFYIFNERFENTSEYLCIIKTHKNLFCTVEATIKSLHTYKIPEIVEISLENASLDYLKWMSESLGM